MTEFLPARIRIEQYQYQSAFAAKRARMQRNAKRKGDHKRFAYQSAIDAAHARKLLFKLIDEGLPPEYAGPA